MCEMVKIRFHALFSTEHVTSLMFMALLLILLLITGAVMV